MFRSDNSLAFSELSDESGSFYGMASLDGSTVNTSMTTRSYNNNSQRGSRLVVTRAALEHDEYRDTSSQAEAARAKYSENAVPESATWRIARSWGLISNQLESVGVDFFLRMFDESPELLQLFHFGGQSFPKDAHGKRILPTALKNHALTVMEFLGDVVAGLTSMEEVIPKLRAIGKVHVKVGVEPQHYEILFRNMMAAIADTLGPEEFDVETRKAWFLAFRSLTNVMKQPDEILQLEPLQGWGAVNGATCAYLAFMSPFEMAGFSTKNSWMGNLFCYLNSFAILVVFVDMCSSWISSNVRVEKKRIHRKGKSNQTRSSSPSSTYTWRKLLIVYPKRTLHKWQRKWQRMTFPITFRIKKYLRSLNMERWSNWPKLDAIVLLSFPLQYSVSWIYGYNTNQSAGVHWSFVFGLLRLGAMFRCIHFLQCAQNNMLLRRRLDNNEKTLFKFTKLLTAMLSVLHVAACLWCIVARIELGPETMEPISSPFFPEAEQLLLGRTGILNSYVRAFHWALVQLAGIGNCDSDPTTTLECIVIIALHLIGLTLYSIMTGHVISVLEEVTSKRHPVGDDLGDLSEFMQRCNIPQEEQKRVLTGYMMHNLLNDGAHHDDPNHLDHNEDDDFADETPDAPEATTRLPSFLRQELTNYGYVEAIKFRNPSFATCCSHECIFAIVCALNGKSMLLPGDFYFKEGDLLPQHFAVIERGSIEVVAPSGKCIRILKRGDVIGKEWLLQTIRVGEALVSLRAHSECRLILGFSEKEEIMHLQRRFAKDFQSLKANHHRTVKQSPDHLQLQSYAVRERNNDGSSTKVNPRRRLSDQVDEKIVEDESEYNDNFEEMASSLPSLSPTRSTDTSSGVVLRGRSILVGSNNGIIETAPSPDRPKKS